MTESTQRIILYAVIATALFVAIYVFYSRNGKGIISGVSGEDGEPTGKEDVERGPGYVKPEPERESE